MNIRRLYQFRRWPRLLRWFGYWILAIIVLYVIEDIHGRVRLAMFHDKWEKAGVTFNLEELWPESVPDEENVFGHTLFQDYLDPETHEESKLNRIEFDDLEGLWAQVDWDFVPDRFASWEFGHSYSLSQWTKHESDDEVMAASAVLEAFAKWETELNAICEAAERPEAVLPMPDVMTANPEPRFQFVLPELARCYRHRALAYLRTSQEKKALRDLLTMLRLAREISEDGVLLDCMVAITIQSVMTDVIWEGLGRYHWNAHQLERLQAELKSWSLARDFPRTMQLEAAYAERSYRHYAADRVELANMMGVSLSALSGLGAPPSWSDRVMIRLTQAFWWSVPSGWFSRRHAFRNRLWRRLS